MPRTVITPYRAKFIRDHYQVMSMKDMAKRFGISYTAVRHFMLKHGLSVPRSVSRGFAAAKTTGRTSFTRKEDNFIRQNYLTMPIKTMARELGRSYCGVNYRMKLMSLVVPREIIEQRIKDSQKKPGHVPANKGKKMSKAAYEKSKHTFYKKGNIPANTKHNGATSVRKDSRGVPHFWIRIRKGVWIHLSRHVWEKHNGPIPPGYVISFRNGDTLNCDIANLELISKADNMRRNQIHKYPPEVQELIIVHNKFKREIRNAEK